jgi:hypothetical protein
MQRGRLDLRNVGTSLGRLDPRLVVTVLLLLVLVAPSAMIMLPPETSTRTTLKVMRYNAGGVPANGHAHGCGTYRSTVRVGRIVGASIHMAAEFCWNGKSVHAIWGLGPGDCQPVSSALVFVKLTCTVSGARTAIMTVHYVAQVQSSFAPFIEKEVTHDVLVDEYGYLMQVPGQ